MGFHIAQRLSEEQKQVVVIDQNPDKLRRIEDNMDVQTILGSGSWPSVLKTAGAEDASIFLAVTDSDETNIVACLFANAIAPDTDSASGDPPPSERVAARARSSAAPRPSWRAVSPYPMARR